MAFILHNKISHHTMLFINDLPVKSRMSQYQRPDGSYKMILENPVIRLFIWKHLTVIHRILQHLQNVNATVSAKKFVLASPGTSIVGHKCTSEDQGLAGMRESDASSQVLRDLQHASDFYSEFYCYH